jgi:hypothetical protein
MERWPKVVKAMWHRPSVNAALLPVLEREGGWTPARDRPGSRRAVDGAYAPGAPSVGLAGSAPSKAQIAREKRPGSAWPGSTYS